MKICAAFLVALLLSACATAPIASRPDNFLRDELFAAPSVKIRSDQIFALSPAMKQYLASDIADQLHKKGGAQGLYDALYSKRQLQLSYDAAVTRNAAEAFDARSGNCLSLVIMTAAFARELGLAVRYQALLTEELWTRSGDLFLSSGHVNITIGRQHINPMIRFNDNVSLTIDFSPLSSDLTRGWGIEESTVIAMYMNNRAAETLAEGRINDAYWFAREAIKHDRDFMAAYNTLGVIYRRHGQTRDAEAVFRHVLANETGSVQSLSNLLLVMKDQNRADEVQKITEQLARKQPYPPYFFFEQAQAAMQQKDYRRARELFAREVRRQPYNAEFHFGLGQAYLGLDDVKNAQRHFVIAFDTSNTRKQQALYAAKLERIQALSTQTKTH